MNCAPDSPPVHRGHARRLRRTRRIETCEQPPAAGLPPDRRRDCISVATGVRHGLFAVAAFAPIYVTNKDAALVIDRHIEKVEQVTCNVGSATSQQTAALHRRVW